MPALCRATCSSRLVFCRESFSKETSTWTKPAGSCCRQLRADPAVCPPAREGKRWQWGAEHHTPVSTSLPPLRVVDALGSPGAKLSVPEDYVGEKSAMLLRQKSPQRRTPELRVTRTRSVLLHQPLAPSLQGTSPAQRGDGGCGDWMSHREWSFLGLIKAVSSLPVCCMFFVALSFEQGPKRWDPDCRHFPGASFCSGVAVLGLMGCSEVTLCSPHLRDHGLLPGSAVWGLCWGSGGSRPRTRGHAASARCWFRAQEAARTPHQMHIVSLFPRKPQKSFSLHSSAMPRQR